MIITILLIAILVVALALLYAIKDSLNQCIRGIEAMNNNLNEIKKKKGA